MKGCGYCVISTESLFQSGLVARGLLQNEKTKHTAPVIEISRYGNALKPETLERDG